MNRVLVEAYELVEKGLLDEAGFCEFVCDNPLRFYTNGNPDFFEGTRCEAAARDLLSGGR